MPKRKMDCCLKTHLLIFLSKQDILSFKTELVKFCKKLKHDFPLLTSIK